MERARTILGKTIPLTTKEFKEGTREYIGRETVVESTTNGVRVGTAVYNGRELFARIWSPIKTQKDIDWLNRQAEGKVFGKVFSDASVK